MNTEKSAAIREEMKTATGLISDFLKTADQVLVLTVAALAAVGTVLGKLSPTTAILVATILPVVVTLSVAYALRAITTIDTLGAYRAELEQALCDEIGMTNIFWESNWTLNLKRSPAYRFAEITFTVAVFGMFAEGVIAAVFGFLRADGGKTHHVVPFVLVTAAYATLASGLLYARFGRRP